MAGKTTVSDDGEGRHALWRAWPGLLWYAIVRSKWVAWYSIGVGTREAFVRLAPQETISEQQYYFSMGAGVITGWLATGFQSTVLRSLFFSD